MIRVFKGSRYAQKYEEFKYREEVTIISGKHNGTSAFVIGETPLKMHVCFPSGITSTLYKCDVRSMKKLLTDTSAVAEVVDDVKHDVKHDVDLFKIDGLDGLETDTVCALRLLMVCFERQGIKPTSNDAYKLFRDFAEEYYSAED